MATTRQAVLLRGVNVGKAKRISAAQLAAVVESTGATEVRTLLNSGNAVCTSALSPRRLADAVGAAIESELGFTCDVLVRDRTALDAVLALDPLGSVATDPSRYLVTFLRSAPEPDRVAALREVDVSPEVWELHGCELYIWMPAGVADSAFAKLLAKGRLGVVWTGRNWTTVSRLRDLM